jgi:hypothetical protein
VLLAFLLLWLLLFRMSHLLFTPTEVGTWWACCDTAVMTAAAWVLYAWFVGDRDGPRLEFAAGDSGVRIARALYGLALIPFGIAHFLYLKDTAPLVPGWLPWPVAWAYFTGGALIAAGVAVLVGVYARPGSRAVRVRDGFAHAAGVGTHRRGRPERLSMERVRRLLDVDGGRLGRGGFLPQHALARSGPPLELRAILTRLDRA